MSDKTTAANDASAAKSVEQIERERLTRREALKKIGITSALTTFALFSVDDLAHMAGKALKRHAGDSKIAAQVAQEIANMDIAFAAGPEDTYYYYYAATRPSNPCGCNGDCTCLCNCTKQKSVAAACKAFPGCCDANNVPLGICSGQFAVKIGLAENAAIVCVAGCPD